MINIKNIIKKNRYLNFNVVERDIWVKKNAKLILSGANVLDIGAGSGPYRNLFKHCNYLSQDFCQLSPEQLRFGSGYSAIDIVSNADNIPLPSASQDVILLTEVLEHVPNPIDVLKEASRLLKNGGIIIITAPLGSGLHQQPFHFYGGYTPYWYEKYLGQFHFINIKIESNGNFFKFFGQEFQRLIQMTNPRNFPKNIFYKFIWLPFWILILPLWFIVPFLCHFIDRYDSEKKFTIGYHVVAIKNLHV